MGLSELRGGGGTYLVPAVGIPPRFTTSPLGPLSFDSANRGHALRMAVGISPPCAQA